MNATVSEKLDELIEAGLQCENYGDYAGWHQRTRAFLLGALGPKAAKTFETAEAEPERWWEGRGHQVGMLEAIAAKLSETDKAPDSVAASLASVPGLNLKKVFLVHGHDSEVKQTVARFLERLGLEPVILHEQANQGRTVIEKFEAFSDVGFAIVLLTPDDLGAANADSDKLKPRARQNVVLELGYFLGKLNRSRVCALYKHGVEIPSDYQGVLYVELDAMGAWRTSLAQELSNARLPIKLEGLLGV
jgi:predicted nucleotide-binding protein